MRFKFQFFMWAMLFYLIVGIWASVIKHFATFLYVFLTLIFLYIIIKMYMSAAFFMRKEHKHR